MMSSQSISITPPSNTVLGGSSKKRGHSSSLLEESIPLSLLPPMKRPRSAFKKDIIKAHATFARMLSNDDCDDNTSSSTTTNKATLATSSIDTDDECANLLKASWSKRSTEQRKALLAKVHPTAERFLSAKGVWNNVAQILDQHFTSCVSSTTTSPSSVPHSPSASTLNKVIDSEPKSMPMPTQMNINAVTETTISKQLVSPTTEPEVEPDSESVFPEPTLSGVAETARELAKTVSLATMKAVAAATIAPSPPPFSPFINNTPATPATATTRTTTPSPVITGLVPNPLAALQGDEQDDMSSLDLVTAFPTTVSPSPQNDSKVPAHSVSVASLSELIYAETDDFDASPMWYLHDEFDPLVLLD